MVFDSAAHSITRALMSSNSGSDFEVLARVHYPPVQTCTFSDLPNYFPSFNMRKEQNVSTTNCASIKTYKNDNTKLERLGS